jgi:hypothetical protein
VADVRKQTAKSEQQAKHKVQKTSHIDTIQMRTEHEYEADEKQARNIRVTSPLTQYKREQRKESREQRKRECTEYEAGADKQPA